MNFIRKTFSDYRNNASYGRLASIICIIVASVCAYKGSGYTNSFLTAAVSFYTASKLQEAVNPKTEEVKK